MNKFPLLVFCIILISAFCTGMRSYSDAEYIISDDVNNALNQTLAEMHCDVISADTIKCYRSYITIAELRDTAGISIRAVRRHGRLETELIADANCDVLTILRLSDQKASGMLLCFGIIWIFGSLWYARMHKPRLVVNQLSFGDIVYSDSCFTTTSGIPIRLTPMNILCLRCLCKQIATLCRNRRYVNVFGQRNLMPVPLSTLLSNA